MSRWLTELHNTGILIGKAPWNSKKMNLDDGSYRLKNVRDKLLSDIKNRKSVLMKTSDQRLKSRLTSTFFGCGCIKVTSSYATVNLMKPFTDWHDRTNNGDADSQVECGRPVTATVVDCYMFGPRFTPARWRAAFRTYVIVLATATTRAACLCSTCASRTWLTVCWRTVGFVIPWHTTAFKLLMSTQHSQHFLHPS